MLLCHLPKSKPSAAQTKTCMCKFYSPISILSCDMCIKHGDVNTDTSGCSCCSYTDSLSPHASRGKGLTCTHSSWHAHMCTLWPRAAGSSRNQFSIYSGVGNLPAPSKHCFISYMNLEGHGSDSCWLLGACVRVCVQAHGSECQRK